MITMMQVAGFLEKNRDGLKPDLEDLISSCGNRVSAFKLQFTCRYSFIFGKGRRMYLYYLEKERIKHQFACLGWYLEEILFYICKIIDTQGSLLNNTLPRAVCIQIFCANFLCWVFAFSG